MVKKDTCNQSTVLRLVSSIISSVGLQIMRHRNTRPIFNEFEHGCGLSVATSHLEDRLAELGVCCSLTGSLARIAYQRIEIGPLQKPDCTNQHLDDITDVNVVEVLLLTGRRLFCGGSS